MEVGEGDDKQSWSRNIWAAAEVGSEASSSFLVLVLSCKLHTAVPFSRVFSGAFGSSPEMTHVHSNITLSPRGDRGRGEHHVVRLQMHPCMTAQEMPVIPTCQIQATLLCRAQGRDSGSLQEASTGSLCYQEPTQSCSQHRSTTLAPLPTDSHSESLDAYK